MTSIQHPELWHSVHLTRGQRCAAEMRWRNEIPDGPRYTPEQQLARFVASLPASIYDEMHRGAAIKAFSDGLYGVAS